MSIIFKKDGLYLSERFEWQRIPYLFPTWHVHVVLGVMERAKQLPKEYAVVNGKGVIDLDNLEFVKLGAL